MLTFSISRKALVVSPALELFSATDCTCSSCCTVATDHAFEESPGSVKFVSGEGSELTDGIAVLSSYCGATLRASMTCSEPRVSTYITVLISENRRVSSNEVQASIAPYQMATITKVYI